MPELMHSTGTQYLRPRGQFEAGDGVQALAWSPDGAQLAVAAVGGSVTLLAAPDASVRQRWAGHRVGCTTLAWRPDGSVLASAGQDGEVRFWSAAALDPVREMAAGAAWVERMAWSPDGRWLAVAAGRRVRCWDAEVDVWQELAAHPATVADIAWSPRGDRFATTTAGGVWTWRPDRPAPLRHYAWKGAGLVVRWSPDERFLATGEQDHTVHFWFADSGVDLRMSGYPRKVQALAWHRSSRWLATDGGPDVCVWDCAGPGPEGREPLLLQSGSDVLVSAVAYQHEGDVLAVGYQDGLVALWRPGSVSVPAADGRLRSRIRVMAWASEDRCLAVGTDDGQVALF